MTAPDVVSQVRAELTRGLQDYVSEAMLALVLERVAAIPFTDIDTYLAVMREVVRGSLQPLVDRAKFERLETSLTVH